MGDTECLPLVEGLRGPTKLTKISTTKCLHRVSPSGRRTTWETKSATQSRSLLPL